MTIRDLASKGTKLWFQWASFKLGFFVGAVCMAIYMAVLFTVPSIAQSIMGAAQ